MQLFSREKRTGVLFLLLGVLASILAALIVLRIGLKMSPNTPVLVANTEISTGDPLERSMFREVMLPEAGLPEGTLRPELDFSNLIAAKKMFPGDLLRVPGVISLDNPDPSVLSARLKSLADESLRAMEIPVESVLGMLGGMKAGDHIDILAVYTVPEEQTAGNNRTTQVLVSDIVVSGAPVIGVRPPVDGPGALVAALTEEQTRLYALSREKGRIYVSLHPFGHQEVLHEPGTPGEQVEVIN